jgi:DNA-binding beta-propeller fold protein YncE
MRRLGALLGLGIVMLALAPGRAHADSCPGALDCPYTTFSLFGNPLPATFARPQAIAVDSAGNVIVGDQLSGVVRKFDPTGVLLAQWGSLGTAPGQFRSVGGIATDATGNVYVLDTQNNRVQKFDPSGNFITTWGKRGTTPGRFRIGWKGGIAVSGSYVYVSDSDNDRIQKFDTDGRFIAAWTTPGHDLDHPLGLIVTGSHVIVADDDNHRLVTFTTDGGFLGTAGSGPGTTLGKFWNPYDVAIDSHGNVFVADNANDRIVELDPTLQPLGSWGSNGSAPGYLKYPRAIAFAANGDLLVANTGNNRIDRYSFTPIPPTLTIASSRQHVLKHGRLLVSAGCDRPCKLRVTGSVALAHGHMLRLRFDHALTTAGAPSPIALSLSKRARSALRRGFSRHKQLTVRLTATPRGTGGVGTAVQLRLRILP